MNRIIVKTRVSSDGSVHLDVPMGDEAAGTEVQVTREPVAIAGKRMLSASDLLDSGLVGMWSERTDIGDSQEFARRLREQAQTRRRDG